MSLADLETSLTEQERAVEKLLCDAPAVMIEDGGNDVLGLVAASEL